MQFKGRPLGLLLICLFLVYGVIGQIFLWFLGEEIIFQSIFEVGLSLYFCIGIFLFNKWAAIIFVFFVGLSAFIATIATLLLLGVNSLGLNFDSQELIASYQQDIIAVLIAYLCVYYLTRKDVRSLFLTDKSANE